MSCNVHIDVSTIGKYELGYDLAVIVVYFVVWL